jgi:hypothetical protein
VRVIGTSSGTVARGFLRRDDDVGDAIGVARRARTTAHPVDTEAPT